MTVTLPASGHHRAAAQAEHIARLFAEGHDLTTVAQQGAVNGWTRQRALQVIEQRGWQLDASGRVPRSQRPAVTPGKPLPPAPAGMPGVGTIGGERPVVAEPKPSPGRAQVAALAQSITTKTTPGAADTASGPRPGTRDGDAPSTVAVHRPAPPVSPPDLPALTTMARAAQQRETDNADALLARADTSGSPRVRELADAARLLLDKLRAALDADEQRERLRARLSELDAERAAILAQLEEVGTRPPEQPAPAAPPATAAHAGPTPAGTSPQRAKKGAASTTPINHGTWGGFLQHRVRGEDACEPCDAAREQTMDARRAKRATKATP